MHVFLFIRGMTEFSGVRMCPISRFHGVHNLCVIAYMYPKTPVCPSRVSISCVHLVCPSDHLMCPSPVNIQSRVPLIYFHGGKANARFLVHSRDDGVPTEFPRSSHGVLTGCRVWSSRLPVWFKWNEMNDLHRVCPPRGRVPIDIPRHTDIILFLWITWHDGDSISSERTDIKFY